MIGPTYIVGSGLIGASIGQCLTAHGEEVFLADADHSHAVVAASRGAGVVAQPRPESVKLVIVATPPDVVAGIVLDALRRYPAATVTDVTSVKTRIEAAVLAGADADQARRYVGSHPMAGSQHAGPLTASPELFLDRTWVLVRRADIDPAAWQRVRDLVALCQAREVDLDAAAHDRAVAAVSHLPQLMASLTAARLLDDLPADLTLAGQGVRDVTRIAASDVTMWRQIVAANTEAVRAQLRAVQDDLGRLLDHLDDPAAVEDLLSRGRAGAAALPGKHGRAASELVPVVVQIPDTPGALARLFADIDRLGVNVEDLSIEHDPVREAGFLAVSVTPERAEPLATALHDAGWLVR